LFAVAMAAYVRISADGFANTVYLVTKIATKAHPTGGTISFWYPLPHMRKVFVICMLLLMPFRGFIGDAMAYQMLMTDHHSAPATQGVAAKPDSKQITQRMPCHTESAPALDDEPQQSKCTVCEVCHSSMAIDSGSFSGFNSPNKSAPLLSSSIWLSADLLRITKPPVF
jgi:hypothetical protein